MASWRLETYIYMLFYLAAIALLVSLPLHLLEHVPSNTVLQAFKQAPRGWVLWAVLIAGGIHAPIGLRNVLYDYVKSKAARITINLICLILSIIIISVGAYGLYRIFPL